MTTRLRLLAILATFALVIAACGGTESADDASNGDGGDTGIGTDAGGTSDDGSGDAGAQDTDGGTSDGDSSTDGTNEPPDLDPGDMPPAGEVRFEVDGQTFTIKADEMDYFICELGGDFTNVRSESETLSLTVQFDPGSERGNASLVTEDDGVQYNSFFGPETPGGVAVEDPYLVYQGRFDETQLDDLSFDEVGNGRVSVTCP